jgi:hypothetical protein
LPGSGRAGKAGLELVTQAGQFGQVGFVSEGLAEPCLIIAKLAFGDGEVLSDAVAFGAVGIGHSFQGVQDGTRPLVSRESVDWRVIAAFEIHVGRELRVKDQAEAQAR